jgi:subtilisin-like proprotein convertase family protein
MKNKFAAVSAALLVWVGVASSQTSVTKEWVFTGGLGIPDGDFNGLSLSTNLSGLSGRISEVTMSLDISGGNNSDLYAFLTGPHGGFAILLNRVGMGASMPDGYEETGFHITLNDTASNIHTYQSGGFTTNSSGQLTGSWAPDGRNIDPQSQPSLFDSTSATAQFESFHGTDPNGTWTIFFADVSGGSQCVLEGMTLNLMLIPEPATLTLTIAGGLGWLLLRRRKRTRL